MKIIFINQSFDVSFGGPAFSVPLLAHGLSEFGLHPVFLDTNSGTLNKNPIIQEHGYAWHSATCRGPSILKFAPDLYQLIIDEIEPGNTIVNINNPWNFVPYYTLKACKRTDTPFIISLRGSFFPWSLKQGRFRKIIAWNFFQREMIEKAKYIHATSEEEAWSFKRLNSTAEVRVVPNPVELPVIDQRTSKHEAKSKLGWDIQNKHLLFFSRIHPKKGLEYVIEAMACDPHSNVKLKIAGGIDDKEYWKKINNLIMRHALASRVDYLGLVDPSQKELFFSACDVFVLTSHSENFGMSIAEAMAYERPVLISKEVPWKSTDRLGAGWIVDLDINVIAKTLKEINEVNEEKLKAMGVAARSYAGDFAMHKTSRKFFETFLT